MLNISSFSWDRTRISLYRMGALPIKRRKQLNPPGCISSVLYNANRNTLWWILGWVSRFTSCELSLTALHLMGCHQHQHLSSCEEPSVQQHISALSGIANMLTMIYSMVYTHPIFLLSQRSCFINI